MHRKGQMDKLCMNLNKKLTLGVILTLFWGYIHEYDHYSQTSLLVYIIRSQVSVYRTIGPSSFSVKRQPHSPLLVILRQMLVAPDLENIVHVFTF